MECTEVNVLNVKVHGEVQSLAVCIGVASIGLHIKTKALYLRLVYIHTEGR